VQCLFCDVWIVTRSGGQYTLALGRRQAREFGRKLALDKRAGHAAAVRKLTEADQLRGAIRRKVASVVGAPVGLALVAHAGLLFSTMGLRPGPKVLDYEFGLTAGVWFGALLFGHGLLSVGVLSSFVLWYLAQHIVHPPRWLVGVDSLTSQSGIDLVLALAVPLGLITVWQAFQTKQSLAHHYGKLQESRGRLLLGAALGGFVGVAIFGGPNLERYLKVHEPGITEHFGALEELCRSAAELAPFHAARALEPSPRWASFEGRSGQENVQPIQCSRLLAREWGYGGEDGAELHPSVGMGSYLGSFMEVLDGQTYSTVHRSTATHTRRAVDGLVEADYWLALEPRGCVSGGGDLVAMLYATASREAVSVVRLPCSPSASRHRRALFDALEDATRGSFRGY
jgi:hypothetical protein